MTAKGVKQRLVVLLTWILCFESSHGQTFRSGYPYVNQYPSPLSYGVVNGPTQRILELTGIVSGSTSNPSLQIVVLIFCCNKRNFGLMLGCHFQATSSDTNLVSSPLLTSTYIAGSNSASLAFTQKPGVSLNRIRLWAMHTCRGLTWLPAFF